jgi:translocation and assembly module TamB
MTRRSKVWIGTALSLLVLVIVLTIISIQVLKSPWFAAYVREKIISTTEESTGGKVEIGSFQFDWRHLSATIQDFVLHGTEPPGDPPLFAANRIDLRLKLLAGLKKAVDLEYLGVDRPSVNVIVFADGRTNVPAPKVVTNSNKTALETVVDLAVHKFEVFNGSAAFMQQSIGFSGHGENLQVQMGYRAVPAGYQGDVKVGALQLAPRGGQPLNASLDLPIEIGNDSIDVRNAVLASLRIRIPHGPARH